MILMKNCLSQNLIFMLDCSGFVTVFEDLYVLYKYCKFHEIKFFIVMFVILW